MNMKIMSQHWFYLILAVVLGMALPLSAAADEKYNLLKQQVDALQDQLNQVQQVLKQYEKQSASKVEVARQVLVLEQEIAHANEWKDPSTLVHLAGYADAGYSNVKNSDGSFNIGSFSPIFHYQYRDLVMLESELEIEVEDDGETELALEYLTVDLFLNDYMTLVGGKFLSPIGSFRQNLHPSWVNKLASAPPGFGHDGAAPISDLGLQLRGGVPVGNTFANYAFYVSNGPELNTTFEDGEYELEGIVAEGFGSDADGEPVFGGRLGFVLFPGFEMGISAAVGKATVTAIEAEHHDEGEEHADEGEDHVDEGEDHADEPEALIALGDEFARDYDVFGADFSWGLSNFRLRGEYVRSKIGKATTGVTASSGATWKSWYTQTSYLLPQTKWELVLRYTDFDSPHSSQDQQQWAFGLNYLFTSNVIGKFGYELNDGLSGSPASDDRFLIQFAYGF